MLKRSIRSFSLSSGAPLSWPNEDFFERYVTTKGTSCKENHVGKNLIDISQYLLVRHAESQANLAMSSWKEKHQHLENTMELPDFNKKMISEALMGHELLDAPLTDKGI